ncbi:unnamed protein product [Rhodiola kirilowii]
MSLKEGQSTNRPPLLEGPNYAYWKSKMKAFLKSLDERAWRAVMIGWTEPMMANPEGAVMPKPEALWSEADDVAAVGNSKALNAIVYGVDENVFKLIAECEVAKEAWDILRIAYEGPDSESNDEEEEHDNMMGLVVTFEDCGETSENPYSSALSEQPVDDASSSDDEGLAHETSAETYKELYEKWLLVINLNKKLTDSVASMTAEKDKMWQEVEILVTQKVELQGKVGLLNTQLTEMKQEKSCLLAQKTELLGTISSLKVDMEKDRETHPVGMAGLRKPITDLKRKEVYLLRQVESLELQVESEQMDHSASMKELNQLKQSVKMLNSGSKNLNEILRSQRMESGHRGLGFIEEGSSKGTTFVKAKPVAEQNPKQKVKQNLGDKVRQHPRQKVDLSQGKTIAGQRRTRNDHIISFSQQRKDSRTCWYCYQIGHIRPRCRLFLAEQRAMGHKNKPRMRRVWIPKASKTVCMAAFNSSCHIEKDHWFFDSGCSAHMTGNPKFLTHIRPVAKGQFVTFGDGGRGQVIGCGTLKVPDLPVLKDILLVEGLKVNLISISQLCDDGLHVSFTHDSYHVWDKEGDTLMRGSRAANNCYLIDSAGTVAASSCLSRQGNKMTLSHRRVGHLTLQTSKKLSSTGLIRGMTNVTGDTAVLCGECQIMETVEDPSDVMKSRATEINYRELTACPSSPKNVNKAFIDEIWVVATHVELGEFTRSEAWKLYHLARSHELKKTMYGLTQAPRAWYETFLIDHGYERGGVEKHMFVTSTQKLVGQFVKVITSKHMTTVTIVLTMPLDAAQFETLRSSLGLRVITN